MTYQPAGDTNATALTVNNSSMTIATSNITFSVAGTNVPTGYGVYLGEIQLHNSATTLVRSLGRGKVRVVESAW